MSWSSSLPIRSPIFSFDTVVILSTISWDNDRNPISLIGFDRKPEQRRLGWVCRKSTDGNRGSTVKVIVLENHGGPRLARVIPATGDRPDLTAPHSLPLSVIVSMKP